MCFGLIHNVTHRLKGFRGTTSTPCGPERLGQPTPRNTNRARLAAFDKIGNVFSLTYSQMIAQQFGQLNVYCRRLYFMKTGHDINCCVFKYRECMCRIIRKYVSKFTRSHKGVCKYLESSVSGRSAILYVPRHANTCLIAYGHNKGAYQTAH